MLGPAALNPRLQAFAAFKPHSSAGFASSNPGVLGFAALKLRRLGLFCLNPSPERMTLRNGLLILINVDDKVANCVPSAGAVGPRGAVPGPRNAKTAPKMVTEIISRALGPLVIGV